MFDWLQDLISGSPLTYLVLLGAAGADVLVPLIPSEAMVVTSGVVAAHGDLEIWLVIPAVALGAMVGDNVSYLLGRELGDPLARRLFRSERSMENLREAQSLVRRHGAAMIVVGRFIPGGRTASTFAAGTLEMPWRRFIVADAVAASLWAVYATMLGYLGGEAFSATSWKPLAGALAAGLLIGAGLEGWRRLQRRRGRDLLGERLGGDQRR